MEAIAKRIDYEVILFTQNWTSYYIFNDTINAQNIESVALEKARALKQSYESVVSDDRVDEAYAILYAWPMPGPNIPPEAGDYLRGAGGGALLVISPKVSDSCLNPPPDADERYLRIIEKVGEEAGVGSLCGREVLEVVDDYVSRLAYITVSTATATPFGTSESIITRDTGLPGTADAIPIIVTNEEAFGRAVAALARELNASGVAIGPAAIAVSIKPEAYVNPASAQATLDRLHRIAAELGEKAGAVIVSTYNADSEIRDYQAFESVGRLFMVFGLVPSILVVLIAANPIAESVILSMRKQVGLLRLRGAGPGMLRSEFAVTTLLTGVAGFMAGAGLTYAVVSAVFGRSGPGIARITLTDPVILGITAFLTGVVLAYTARRARKVIAELPPSEAIKTTLTPEELLKPLRVGGLGWFAIITGLYFVVTGYLGWSATTAMLNYMVSTSGPPNIGLFIVLVILAMFEGFLKPFAPILLAYGIAKYVAVNYDKIMERVARSGVLGELTFVGKGLIGVMRRRVTAILILTIFTVSVLAQTYISTTAGETLLNSAIVSSLGNEYGAFLDLRMNSSTGVGELSNYLAGTGCGAAIGIQTLANLGGGTSPAVLVIVPNPESFLSNSVWYPSWSWPDPFDEALKGLGSTNVMFLAGTTPFIGLGPKGVGVGNVTTIESWVTNVSISVSIAEETKGFPGYGLLSASPTQGLIEVGPGASVTPLIIAGPSIASVLDDSLFLAPGSRLRVVVVGDDNSTVSSCIEGLKSAVKGFGMEPVGEGYVYVGDLEVAEAMPGSTMFLSQASVSITQAVILIGLAVAFSVILSWSVTKEVIRVYLLLRVRGASARDIARIGAVKWGLLAAVAVALGLFVGGALGRGTVSTSMTGLSLLSISAVASNGVTMPVNLEQGVMTPYIPPEGWAIVAATAAALTAFPLVITLRVFRGAVREKFIEVR